MKKISIVSSAFNEQGNVAPLYEAVRKEMAKWADKYDYEQIILDNGSTDNTLAELRRLAAQDKHLKVIANARNFGHIRSPYYGILQAYGDAVVYLASDLQDPPELISRFITEWERGFKVVLGQKQQSYESKLFFGVRKIYYWLLNLLNDSGTDLVPNCTGFGLYDKCVVDELRRLADPYPYLRLLCCSYLHFDPRLYLRLLCCRYLHFDPRLYLPLRCCRYLRFGLQPNLRLLCCL